MQREESYWRGMKARLLRALVCGLVAGLVLWWTNDLEVSVLSGLLVFAAIALAPPGSPRGDRT
jgi:hypothetical protein